VSDTAFVAIVVPAACTAPGVDALRLPDLGFWDTSAVHGWLQAFDAEDGSLVRVVDPADADLLPEDTPRLEVPVSEGEAAAIAQAGQVPAAAEARAELLTFRRMLTERPAMVARARTAGLSGARIDDLAGAPLAGHAE
jgi:hypothetical protein